MKMEKDIVYLIPHVLIGACFLLSIVPYINEKKKLTFQIVAHSLLAVLFGLAPTYYLQPTITGKFTNIHGFIQAFCSALHVGQGYFLWKTRNLGRQEQSVTLSKVIVSFMSILTRCFAAWHLTEKSTKGLPISNNFLYCVLFTDGFWFISEMIRMFRNRRTPQDEIEMMVKRTMLWTEGKGSFFMENVFYFDAAMTLIYAIIHFAFPQHVLRLILKPDIKLDSHHYLWCRLYGVLNLMPAVTSMTARFFTPEAQTAYIASRLLSQCTVFLLNIYGHWILTTYSANHITAFMMSGFFTSFLFSAFHKIHKQYFTNEKDDELDDEDELPESCGKKHN